MNTRVKIVNHILNRTTIVESPREMYLVLLDLLNLVRRVNRRRDETLRASVHLTPDCIVLRWHCPSYYDCCGLAAEILEVGEPLHEVEKLIWGGKEATA